MTVGSTSLTIVCSDDEGDFCGPFPIRAYYCGNNGPVSNGVNTNSFGRCTEHLSCDSGGRCVGFDPNENARSYRQPTGGTDSDSETISGGGTSASSSTNKLCRPCVLDTSLDPRRAATLSSQAVRAVHHPETSISTIVRNHGSIRESVQRAMKGFKVILWKTCQYAVAP